MYFLEIIFLSTLLDISLNHDLLNKTNTAKICAKWFVARECVGLRQRKGRIKMKSMDAQCAISPFNLTLIKNILNSIIRHDINDTAGYLLIDGRSHSKLFCPNIFFWFVIFFWVRGRGNNIYLAASLCKVTWLLLD